MRIADLKVGDHFVYTDGIRPPTQIRVVAADNWRGDTQKLDITGVGEDTDHYRLPKDETSMIKLVDPPEESEEESLLPDPKYPHYELTLFQTEFNNDLCSWVSCSNQAMEYVNSHIMDDWELITMRYLDETQVEVLMVRYE